MARVGLLQGAVAQRPHRVGFITPLEREPQTVELVKRVFQDIEDTVGGLLINVIATRRGNGLPVEHNLPVKAARQVFVTEHLLVALQVERQAQAARDAIVLEKVGDAEHHQRVEARVEVNGRRAPLKLLVRGVQETEVGLRHQLVDGILHSIGNAHGDVKLLLTLVRYRVALRGTSPRFVLHIDLHESVLLQTALGTLLETVATHPHRVTGDFYIPYAVMEYRW